MARLLHASLLVLLTAPAVAGGGNPAVQLDGWHVEGGQAGARLGESLATADVNGDGLSDLVVGAPGASVAAVREGRVLVFLGSSGGLATAPDWTARGWQAGARLGTEVARAGDVNGDGFDDVVVAAPGWDRHAGAPKVFATGALDAHERWTSDEGAVLVFHGSPTGLAPTPARVIVGIERGERFASAIAGAGDVDGDGYDDLLVGATGKAGGLGGVFLFGGSPAGTSALPSWIRVGAAPGTWLGSVVTAAGDVNADGFADFVVGEPSGTPCGALLLFRGSPAGPPLVPNALHAESAILPGLRREPRLERGGRARLRARRVVRRRGRGRARLAPALGIRRGQRPGLRRRGGGRRG